jgi:hypothetical protein
VELDAVAEELYGTPPKEFTGVRDERAARAREEGDRELAKRIKALRRPTLSAWACNLLARERKEETEPLLRLGEALRQAHRDLDGGVLRDLSRQRQMLVAALARQAVELTAAAGHRVGDAAREEIEGTLRAVLADPEAAEAWAAGRLTKPLTAAPGFGAASGAAPPGLRLVPPPEEGAGEPDAQGPTGAGGGTKGNRSARRGKGGAAHEARGATHGAAEREHRAAERGAAEEERRAEEREAAERERRRRELEDARAAAEEAARALGEAEEETRGADQAAEEAADRVIALEERIAGLEEELQAARAETREAKAGERATRDRAREAARHLREARRRATTAETRAERLAADT